MSAETGEAVDTGGGRLVSGREALVRLPIAQRALDRRAGHRTAGFITGYRGSPLGGYDSELWRSRALLEAHDIVFRPGLNEDMAATAVWGTQQVHFAPRPKVEGVFALWYGKGPGVDRSGDPIKHANLQGVSALGGVVLAFGDDHAGKSSTTAHQSDIALAAHGVPILYPASVAEIIDLGLAGFALSRFAGVLVGLKLVNETAEATAVFAEAAERAPFVVPEAPEPPGGVHIRKEFLAVQEQDARLVRWKLPRAQAFAYANRLDGIVFGASRPKFVVACAGKTYADVLGALDHLGLDQDRAEQLGIGLYKVAMIYPLEPRRLAEIAESADEILFVEEKRPHMEEQARSQLFNWPARPRISGKADPAGRALLPADTVLDALMVAAALGERLEATIASPPPDLKGRIRLVRDRIARRSALVPSSIARRPAFCAGCPHNLSTTVPEGSLGVTGIGCHGMAVFHPERNPLPVSHMGGEGGAWLGMAPFTETAHVFQNLGDGTYNHSGSLAIRAAVQAGVNITYKILFNDAVAMTGGQPVEGALTVGRIVAQMRAEGVAEIHVVSDNPERFAATTELPAGMTARPREDLDSIQRRLRDVPGVTVLVYDQTCAAEKRRRRKLKIQSDPPRRVFINSAVCEGCGDCSAQSNCVAIQPLETELGRKRAIDQSACNKDFSCQQGFCPAFVTLEGARVRRAATATAEPGPLPDPVIPPLGQGCNLIIAGVGGTGVVTISAMLGRAARFDGFGAGLYDMTGLSQKNGAVFSHVRLRPDGAAIAPARVGTEEADLIIACDLIAAAQNESLQAIAFQRTVVVGNTEVTATADFQSAPDLQLPVTDVRERLQVAAGSSGLHLIPAATLARRHLGDSLWANVVLLGFAWQNGLLPLSRTALEQALGANSASAKANLEAFRVGRAAALPGGGLTPPASPKTLDEFIDGRVADLRAYQDGAYAERYAGLIALVRDAERLACGADERFGWAVARGAFKLMAYKDEYEIARLFGAAFRREIEQQFDGVQQIRAHLAPPLLAKVDPRTGRPAKRAFGPWIWPAFNLLAPFKRLRGTPLDPFGYTAERRAERELRDLYLAKIVSIAERLTPENHGDAVAFAERALQVRGFGSIKRPAMDALIEDLRGGAVRGLVSGALSR